jgi:hypothetical protein
MIGEITRRILDDPHAHVAELARSPVCDRVLARMLGARDAAEPSRSSSARPHKSVASVLEPVKITAPRPGAMVARCDAWCNVCWSCWRRWSWPRAAPSATPAIARATARATSHASGPTRDRRAGSRLARIARPIRAVRPGNSARRSQTRAARRVSDRCALRRARRRAAIPVSSATRPARANRSPATRARRARRISSAIRRLHTICRVRSTRTRTAARTCRAARMLAVPPAKRVSTARVRARPVSASSCNPSPERDRSGGRAT